MTEYDSSNPKHIAIAKREDRALAEAREAFINHIMGMVDGRAYVHDLLVYSHVFAHPFSISPYETAFACGQLDVGQVILRQVMASCPDSYVQMMREANARSTTSDVRRSRSNKDSNGDDSGSIPEYHHPGEAAGDDRQAASDAEYNPVDRDED